MRAERQLLSVNDVVEATGIGRTTIFSLLKSGDLKAVKVGHRTFVRPSDLDEFVKRHADHKDGATSVDGVALRDWFAGQALSGLLAESNHSLGLPVSSVVSAAYLYADEMIAQRLAGQSSD